MARYWLGPWAWIDGGNGTGYWQMPSGAQSAVDLRSPAACAVPTTPTGVGLFLTPNATSLGADYTNLGTDPAAVLSAGQKAALRTLLSLPRAISATDLQGVLWEALTTQSDPDGLDRMLPLVPNGRRYELWFGGARARQLTLDVSLDEFVPFIAMMRRLYRQHRQESLNGVTPPNHYRKLLGYWVRKYRLNYRLFQPNDVPDEPDLPPETSISDDFTRSDADALGTAAGGWSWTEVTGDVDIVSNRAQGTPDAPAYARAHSALSGNDNYAQAVVTTTSTSNLRQGGPACRADSSAATYYWGNQAANAGTTGTFRIYKSVTGTRTALGTGTTQNKSGDTKKIEANGSTITAYVNGVSVESITDSSIASGLYTGIAFERPNNLFQCDDFAAADISVGGTAYDESGKAVSLLALTGRTEALAMAETARVAATLLALTGNTDARALLESGKAVPLLALTGQTALLSMAETGRAVPCRALTDVTQVAALLESGKAVSVLLLIGETDLYNPATGTFVLLTAGREAETLSPARAQEIFAATRRTQTLSEGRLPN